MMSGARQLEVGSGYAFIPISAVDLPRAFQGGDKRREDHETNMLALHLLQNRSLGQHVDGSRRAWLNLIGPRG
jgi:hypothetical protein